MVSLICANYTVSFLNDQAAALLSLMHEDYRVLAALDARNRASIVALSPSLAALSKTILCWTRLIRRR